MPFDAKAATNLVVALAVMGIMAAFLLPVAIGAISGPEELTATQAVDETVNLNPKLNATVTNVTDGTSATYNVTYDGTTVSGTTVNVGSESTVTVDGVDVTINTTAATSTNATTTYTYPTTAGWGNGAGALWGIIPVVMVLAAFLFFTYVALKRM